jgi:phosphopantothenoylcysteine decarboxylase/phosphopantothenate--cysteine ligase
MQQLCIKRILLGVTFGITAIKAAELTRKFHKTKAEVRVVMTTAAQEFITSLTLQALSENLVHYLIFVFQPLNGHFYVEW